MPILEIDLSKPAQATPQKFGTWSPTKFSDIYKNQPTAPLIAIAGSAGIDWGKLDFNDGLIIQASRVDSENLGEVLGIFIDVSSLQPFESIRVEVHFDVLQVRKEIHYPTRTIRVPTYRRGIGLGWREIIIPAGLPVLKQFVGGLAAVVTAEDMAAGVITEVTDKMAVGSCYIRYAPGAQLSPDESVSLGAGIFGQMPPDLFPWVPMKFFTDAFGPIVKNPSAPPNIWDGNPFQPYVLELLLESSKNPAKKAPQGIGLKRTADNGILGPGPYLDTSQITARDFNDDLSSIRYAGANIVIAQFKRETGPTAIDPIPPRNFGPARVRIKKLLVECN